MEVLFETKHEPDILIVEIEQRERVFLVETTAEQGRSWGGPGVPVTPPPPSSY